MLSIIIDVVLLVILAICVWKGYNKGLILGISGVLALIIAFYGAGVISRAYSSKFSPMIEPFVSGLVDKSVSETQDEYENSGTPTTSDTETELDTVGMDSLLKLGVFKGTAQKIINDLKQSVTDVGQGFKSAVVEKVTSSISYILTFAVVFLLIIILFTIAANLINLAFKLPGLDFINDVGGGVLGGLKGLLILFAIAWAMRYMGLILPEATLNKTLLLRFLMNNNLLTAFLGI